MATEILTAVNPVSGAVVFAVVRSQSTGLYYNTATGLFGVWVGADNQIAMTEDASMLGLYRGTVLLDSEWDDGAYEITYYTTALLAANVLGGVVSTVVGQVFTQGSTTPVLGVTSIVATPGPDPY